MSGRYEAGDINENSLHARTLCMLCESFVCIVTKCIAIFAEGCHPAPESDAAYCSITPLRFGVI